MYTLILHGRKSLQLQKSLQNLFFSFPNSLSFATATATATAANVSPREVRKGNTFTVSYLVGSLGLDTKLAESISKKVSFVDKANPDSVLNLFRSHDFTDSQISTIITSYPKLLMITDAEESLTPKLQFLKSRGAPTSELTEIVSKVPQILSKRGEKTMSRYYDFVKEIVQADNDNSSKLFLSLPEEGSKQKNKIRNISLLREIGVPQRLLFPLLISRCANICGKERFQESLNKVIDMGFDPTTQKFLNALRVFYQSTDKTIQEKVNAYEKFGFTEEDVWVIFKMYPFFVTLSEKNILNSFETLLGLGFSRDEVVLLVKRFPSCIASSTETLKKKCELLVKTMGWTTKTVVSSPAILGMSMEKRLEPRCNVIKALVSKGLLGRDKMPTVSSVLKNDDQVFLKKYVKKHVGIEPELMAVYTAGRGS